MGYQEKRILFHLAILIDVLSWEMKKLGEKQASAFSLWLKMLNKHTYVCMNLNSLSRSCTWDVWQGAFASVGCMGAIPALATSFQCCAQFEYANHPLIFVLVPVLGSIRFDIVNQGCRKA